MMAAQRPLVAGGVRAVVVVPGPNYGAQGRWCRRAEVLVALLKSESSNRSNTASSRRAKTAGPHLKVPSHRLAKAKEARVRERG